MQTADYVITNATIVDGSGQPRFTGEVAIAGERIHYVGPNAPHQARHTLDAQGLVLAPGFIDVHTHDDLLMLSDGVMAPKISQGVTTVVAGNCGISLAPAPNGLPAPVEPPLDLLDKEGKWYRFPTFGSYVSALQQDPPATNSALLVGHTTLRVVAMSDLQRPATQDEIDLMKALLEEAMQAGAIGLSSGLAYPPAFPAKTDELVQLAQVVARYGGLYSTHLRDEADGVVDALEEAFYIGRAANIPVVVSHHKVAGTNNFGRSKETLALIKKYMPQQEIILDCYPYSASSTILATDKVATSKRVTITWSQAKPEMNGRDLDDIMKEWNCSAEEAVTRLQPAGAIYHRMSEDDVQRILAFEDTLVGSDGLPHDAAPHPRLWGSFPRVLGHYVRELKLLTLEEAIHKMTGLSAAKYGFANRGLIRPGAYADLVLFDPHTIDARANFDSPTLPAVGIQWVMVNGTMVWREGEPTAQRPGQVLHRSAQDSGLNQHNVL